MTKRDAMLAATVLGGRYRVGEPVGRGGLGVVYRGVDLQSGWPVAVKVLHTRYRESSLVQGFFHQEAWIARRLSHPNILSIREVVWENDLPCLVMPFVSGWSVQELVRKWGALPPVLVFSIGFQLLKALDYLHLFDVVHADVSPGNVMLSRRGQVFLMDFGLATEMRRDVQPDRLVGTPGYHSPEHLRGEPLLAQSDLYQLALVLLELLIGQRVLEPSDTPTVTLARMRRLAPGQTRLFRHPVLNRAVSRYFSRSLFFRAASRFVNAREALGALAEALAHLGVDYAEQPLIAAMKHRFGVDPLWWN